MFRLHSTRNDNLLALVSPCIGGCILSAMLKNSTTIKAACRTSVVNHIACSGATQTATARRLGAACHCDDCYCFTLGSVHERICDVQEKASVPPSLLLPLRCCCIGCWSVERFAAAFIQTQMRFIAPLRTSVHVSPSFDDEINKLRPPNNNDNDDDDDDDAERERELWLYVQSQQQSCGRPDTPTSVRPPDTHHSPAEVAANRSKMDRPGSGGRENLTRPDAGRLICNRVGLGQVVDANWCHRHIARQTRTAQTWRYTDRLTDWL